MVKCFSAIGYIKGYRILFPSQKKKKKNVFDNYTIQIKYDLFMKKSLTARRHI